MLLVYSILLTAAFVVLLPLFLMRRQKYVAGFSQRLGNYPPFEHNERRAAWIHCVSVGEVNAARPLIERFAKNFPDHRLIVSTTTRTGQDLARRIFADKAETVIYFPFDWKFSVKRALATFRPSLVMLMETEIWPRFIREAKASGAAVAIVNGRLSERSARRYSLLGPLIRPTLDSVDLALMQADADARRIVELGMDSGRTFVTGNLKYDIALTADEDRSAGELDERFGLSASARPVIVAASTHEPEERWAIEAWQLAASKAGSRSPRLLIAPRHPERFDRVADLCRASLKDGPGSTSRFVRRSDPPSPADGVADLILLDSIGELRSIYRTARIVFVGGSLIPHGGQSLLEPATAGAALITGPYTHNFEDVVRSFTSAEAVVRLPAAEGEANVPALADAFSRLLNDDLEHDRLSKNAIELMRTNRGAIDHTIEHLRRLAR